MAKRQLELSPCNIRESSSPPTKKPDFTSPPPTRKSSLEFMSPSKHAMVEGLISSLSPMGKKYFDGELTDGDNIVRLVGFDVSQHNKLLSYCRDKVPVKITNCEMKQG